MPGILDPELYVKQSSGGWSILRAQTADEAEKLIELLSKSMQHSGPTALQPAQE
jgi:hypothetical protein